MTFSLLYRAGSGAGGGWRDRPAIVSGLRAVALALGLYCVAAPASAAINVLACEPEWAALVGEIAGDKVNVTSATTAAQDPHRIEARPSLIARARNADLLVCSGSDLESGWLPPLLSQSGNRRIQPGGPGYVETSQLVTRLEIPTVHDRAQGDIHPGGNPHVHTDPRNIARIASSLIDTLARVDAANATAYRLRGKAFLERWSDATQRWEQKAAPLKGMRIVVHHKEWSYLVAWLGMKEVGSLEPKPGVQPTPTHLGELVTRMKSEPAKAIVYGSYNDPAAARFLAQRTGITAVQLPYTVGGSDRAKDLFGLFDDTIDRLLVAANAAPAKP
jgi:zinc/manganese transport system substrate-binding protein